MVCKCAWLVTAALVVVLLSNLTKQHYIPPTDFCAFAKVCNHTGVSFCGVEKQKENSRLFLDECDLYEYNCDNHKDYSESNIEKCTSNATSSTKPSTISTFVSSIETNASKTVNTAESSTKTTPETVTTTNSSSNVTCICPTEICPNITNITSTSGNSTKSSINISVSLINTTPFINSTEETSLANTKVTDVLTNTTTSIEAIVNDTTTKRVPNETVTEVTTEFTTFQVIINATAATALSSTSAVTTSNVTCTSNPTSTITEEIITFSVPISESVSKTTKFEKNTIGNEEIKTSQSKCEYPKHCNRPRTWETTAKGETRDFYQILRAQFGDRVKVLRGTTHFPQHIAKYYSNDYGFQFGHHNEKMNEIK